MKLQPPTLDHLWRMTDDTGIIQHATGSIPDRKTGYTTDDNARALIAALWAFQRGEREAAMLVERYMAFLGWAQEEDGTFHNEFTYDRRPVAGGRSEDATGQAVWALGEVIAARERGWAEAALPRLRRWLEAAPRPRYIRSAAFALLGLARAASGELAEPLARRLEEAGEALTGLLLERYHDARRPGWEWVEDRLTYANGAPPAALLAAGRTWGWSEAVAAGERMLRWLDDLSWEEQVLVPVGNQGWYARGGEKARFDQQPIDPAWMVLAHVEAAAALDSRSDLERAESALGWFGGRNLLGLPLVDPVSGGCHDGLGREGLNANQGAESTLAWLLAFYGFERARNAVAVRAAGRNAWSRGASSLGATGA
ncbi:MAG: glycosyl transferase [Bacillota bacterium]|nr:glycosyl transferase [Bacillota bacterium]